MGQNQIIHFLLRKNILYEELRRIPTHSYVSGGSALNTIRLAQQMAQGQKNQVKFIKCLGKRDKLLIESTINDGQTSLFDEQQYPAGKRAVKEIKIATVLFCEVYFLYPRADLTKYVFKVAKESNVNTCLSLSSVMKLMIDLMKFYQFYLVLIIYLEIKKKQNNFEKF